jgi:ABC-2 type transport system permease protein
MRAVPGFLPAAASVTRFALPELLWSTRARWVGLALLWPVVWPLAALLTGAQAATWDQVGGAFYLDTLIPLAALIHASRLIRGNVEARTIVYLLSRPVSRAAVFAGHFAAYLAAMLIVAVPALVGGFLLATPGPEGRTLGVLLRALAAAGASTAVYGALFGFLGLVLRKPLVVGLLVLFGWELLANGPGLLPRVTLTAQIRTLAGVGEAIPGLTLAAAAITLAVMAAMFLAASVAVFKYGEWVPE